MSPTKKKKRKPFVVPAAAVQSATVNEPGDEVHHAVAMGAVLGPAVGAAADAELEPDREHEAKAEEP